MGVVDKTIKHNRLLGGGGSVGVVIGSRFVAASFEPQLLRSSQVSSRSLRESASSSRLGKVSHIQIQIPPVRQLKREVPEPT